MTSRGIRNNNPGNIRKSSINWQGLAKEQTDSDFLIFSSMTYGCRALLKIINTYYTQRNCKTIRSIINRYAPPNENNTEFYITHVSQQCNVSPDEIIKLTKENHLILAKAIAKHENGSDVNLISEDIWNKAYNLI